MCLMKRMSVIQSPVILSMENDDDSIDSISVVRNVVGSSAQFATHLEHDQKKVLPHPN